jgi:hypothetical protein
MDVIVVVVVVVEELKSGHAYKRACIAASARLKRQQMV